MRKNIADITVDEKVEVAGFIHDFRNLGKIRFALLRDWTGTLQLVFKKDTCKNFEEAEFNREDVISAKGIVKESKIAHAGKELVVEEFKILSKVKKKLPVDPAERIESDLDTRLKFRFLDLRKPKIQNIFRVKSEIANAFRDILRKKDFIEIHPTAIVAAATEGGAEVFPVEYFEQRAYLAQSPQLYKQMAVIGGLEKVYSVMNVFRAEKHHTTTHLNEIIQMDVEMAFTNYWDAMDLLEEVFLYILNKVHQNPAYQFFEIEEEIPKKVPKYTYTEIIELLNENNISVKWGQDFNKEQERKIWELLEEDAFIIFEWPTKSRAFYSMPKEGDENVCLAYDLLYKGLEIASGAQRIHIPELLEEQLKKRGLPIENFEFYLEAFRYGAPPHAGWSIGLERLTMKILNLHNIREVMLFPRDRTRILP